MMWLFVHLYHEEIVNADDDADDYDVCLNDDDDDDDGDNGY